MKHVFIISIMILTAGILLVNTNCSTTTSIKHNFSGLTCIQADNSRVYVGTRNGLYISSDNCNSWIRIANCFRSDDIYDCKISGNNIYLATRCGLSISYDYGKTWDNKNIGFGVDWIYSIYIDGTTIYAGTDRGIVISYDNGYNWINKYILNDCYVYKIYEYNNTIYGATDSGLSKSTDTGNTWKKIQKFDSYNYNINSIYADNNLICVTNSSGFFISKDNGTTWINKNIIFPNNSAFLSFIVKSFSGKLYAALDDELYIVISSDNGDTWVSKDLTKSYFGNVRDLFVLGSTIYVLSSDVLIKSADDGSTWSIFNPANSNIIGN